MLNLKNERLNLGHCKLAYYRHPFCSNRKHLNKLDGFLVHPWPSHPGASETCARHGFLNKLPVYKIYRKNPDRDGAPVDT